MGAKTIIDALQATLDALAVTTIKLLHARFYTLS